MPDRTGMQHLTLDTGHTRVSFRDEIRPDVLGMLAPMTRTGTHDLPHPFAGCEIKVTVDGTAAMVTVFRDDAPLVTFGVAADQDGADALWPVLGADVAEPSAVPWLAARLEPGLALHPDDGHWLGDFERCWAWAWLTAVGG